MPVSNTDIQNTSIRTLKKKKSCACTARVRDARGGGRARAGAAVSKNIITLV